MFIYYIMSRFNTNSTHPLIPNAQQYMFEQTYVSIHSEDRNILKYPNASEFEIELPQDYLNVQGARLASGYFPFTIYTFSAAKKIIPCRLKLQRYITHLPQPHYKSPFTTRCITTLTIIRLL